MNTIIVTKLMIVVYPGEKLFLRVGVQFPPQEIPKLFVVTNYVFLVIRKIILTIIIGINRENLLNK